MKVFDRTDGFEGKVNFVDKNNVVLGYDLSQNCCEMASWYLRNNNKEKIKYSEGMLEDYNFDSTYFEVETDSIDDHPLHKYADTYRVVFRVVSEGKPDIFIVLENTHNGYYQHGFKFCKSELLIKEGWL